MAEKNEEGQAPGDPVDPNSFGERIRNFTLGGAGLAGASTVIDKTGRAFVTDDMFPAPKGLLAKLVNPREFTTGAERIGQIIGERARIAAGNLLNRALGRTAATAAARVAGAGEVAAGTSTAAATTGAAAATTGAAAATTGAAAGAGGAAAGILPGIEGALAEPVLSPIAAAFVEPGTALVTTTGAGGALAGTGGAAAGAGGTAAGAGTAVAGGIGIAPVVAVAGGAIDLWLIGYDVSKAAQASRAWGGAYRALNAMPLERAHATNLLSVEARLLHNSDIQNPKVRLETPRTKEEVKLTGSLTLNARGFVDLTVTGNEETLKALLKEEEERLKRVIKANTPWQPEWMDPIITDGMKMKDARYEATRHLKEIELARQEIGGEKNRQLEALRQARAQEELARQQAAARQAAAQAAATQAAVVSSGQQQPDALPASLVMAPAAGSLRIPRIPEELTPEQKSVGMLQVVLADMGKGTPGTNYAEWGIDFSRKTYTNRDARGTGLVNEDGTLNDDAIQQAYDQHHKGQGIEDVAKQYNDFRTASMAQNGQGTRYTVAHMDNGDTEIHPDPNRARSQGTNGQATTVAGAK